MEAARIVGLAIVGAVLCVVMRQYKPEYAMFLSIATTILLTAFSLELLNRVLASTAGFLQGSGIKYEYFSILLRVIAVSYVTQFCADICRDVQESAIAAKVELAGKMLILVMAMPIYIGVFQTIDGILQ